MDFKQVGNQKGSAILSILVILVLVAGMVFGVITLRSGKLNIFKSKASADTIVVKDSAGNSLPVDSAQNLPVTKSLNVQVQLNVPPR